MDNEEILATFYQECDDQLQTLEDGLSEMEDTGGDPDTINAVFRAVHSIKGGAASFGLTRLAHFSHKFESALSGVRDGEIAVNDDNVAIFLHAMDVLADLVKEAQEEGDTVGDEEIQQATQKLSQLVGEDNASEEPDNGGIPADFEPIAVDFDFGDEDEEGEKAGDTAQASSKDTSQDGGQEKDTHQDRTAEENDKVKQSINAVLGEKPKAEVKKPAPAHGHKKNSHNVETIRVNLDKVDCLMNLVGELVIAQSSLENTNSAQRAVTHMESLVRDLQESVMSIRAQPISTVFQRMKRVVREASMATEKKVQLTLEGEETEIDRTLVEQLVDPLTHILRNAVDHGIEDKATRVKEGKTPQGHILLKAEQKSGRIVITITDDGGGINRAKVKEIALKRGLIDPDDALSEEDIDNLICSPGFSTNEKVTDLSGRGVGMDVVKSVIQTLGGKMMIKSEPEKGTEFSLSMPLTLAVMDGMLIKTGGTVLVVPVSAINGIAQIDDSIKSVTLPDGGRVTHIRDRSLPLLNMAQMLGFPSDGKEGCLLITEDETGGGAAFEVDDIIDQKQVVIKSLEKNYHKITGVSGATILGDGSVALIIDPGALVNG